MINAMSTKIQIPAITHVLTGEGWWYPKRSSNRCPSGAKQTIIVRINVVLLLMPFTLPSSFFFIRLPPTLFFRYIGFYAWVSSEAPRTEIDGSWRKIKHLNLPRNPRNCGLFGTCNPPQLRRYRVSAFFLNILAGPIEFQRKELEFRIENPLFQAKNHPFGSAWKKPCSAATHKKSYSQKFSLGQNLMGFESYFQKHIISQD